MTNGPIRWDVLSPVPESVLDRMNNATHAEQVFFWLLIAKRRAIVQAAQMAGLSEQSAWDLVSDLRAGTGTPMPTLVETLRVNYTRNTRKLDRFAARKDTSAVPRPVPAVVEDVPEFAALKPDPLAAASLAELRTLLVEFWEWSGEWGSRRIAAGSDGAFSHVTVRKLLTGQQVPLTLAYVRGMIAGCGGDTAEQQRWITAFRKIKRLERQNATDRATA